MPFDASPVASVGAGSPDTNTFTTTGIDTSGANFLVAIITSFVGAAAPTLSDSKGNSWIGLTTYSAPVERIRVFYAVNPVVGTGHTFTVTQAGAFATISVMAWKWAHQVSPADQDNGATSSAAATIQPGSITPVENNELIVSGYGPFSTAPMSAVTIDEGMTILHALDQVGSAHLALCSAYKVQTVTAAINPTWNLHAAAADTATNIASFKIGQHLLPVLGVGN